MIDANLAWEFLNLTAFDGEMDLPKIYVFKHIQHPFDPSLDVHGAYHVDGEIWLMRRPDWLEVLYHEMCHQYLVEVNGDNVTNHGKEFQEVYEAGLPKLERAARKRRGSQYEPPAVFGTHLGRGKLEEAARGGGTASRRYDSF